MSRDFVCHCGLGPEDHYYGGPAEHSYVEQTDERPDMSQDDSDWADDCTYCEGDGCEECDGTGEYR